MIEVKKNVMFCETFIEWGVIGLIFFTPIAFSTVEVWSESIMEIGVFLLTVIWFFKTYLQKKFSIIDNPINLIIVVFVCFITFQLIQFPNNLTGILSPNTKKTIDFYTNGISIEIGFKAISLNPWATKNEFVTLVTYAMTYFLVANNFNRREGKKRLVLSIITIGFIESFYGIVQYVSGEKMIFKFSKLFHATDRLIGTFPSADHFSAYIKMCIFISIGYLIYFSDKKNSNKHYELNRTKMKNKKRKLNFSKLKQFFISTEKDIEKRIMLVLIIVIMIVALIFTKSRGGILSFLISFVFLCVLIFFRGALKDHLWALSAIILITLILGCWIGFIPVFDRYFNISIKGEIEEGRFSIWKSTYNIFRDYPVFGTGFGTFEYIFPLYSLRTNQAWVNHAHNDWLELLSDTGVVGFTIIFLGTIYLMIFSLKDTLKHKKDAQIWILIACYTSVLSMIIHSFVDFNLKTSANSFLTAVIIGLMVSLSDKPFEEKKLSK